MSRKGYYNLKLTPERTEAIAAIAEELGLDTMTGGDVPPNTVGKVIDFSLRTMRFQGHPAFYQKALAAVELLKQLNPDAGTSEDKLLKVLIDLLSDFEETLR